MLTAIVGPDVLLLWQCLSLHGLSKVLASIPDWVAVVEEKAGCYRMVCLRSWRASEKEEPGPAPSLDRSGQALLLWHQSDVLGKKPVSSAAITQNLRFWQAESQFFIGRILFWDRGRCEIDVECNFTSIPHDFSVF